YRGWLVRRVCALLAAWSWKVPADSPGDLPARICSSKRLQHVPSSLPPGSRGERKEKILQILAQIQAPLCLLLLRLCHWALLKLLRCLFLSLQLHRGQLEMVLRASSTPGLPLVFLSRHKSRLDGLLLSFVLFSQGLGVPRVAVGGQPCSPGLRALLRHLGGIFLPERMEQDKELLEAVLTTYVEELLRCSQPLLLFLEEPPMSLQPSGVAEQWLALVYRAVRDGALPDALLVPVGISYDLVPGGAWQDGAQDGQPLGMGASLWAVCQALCQSHGCVRVDFAQPFSLQVQAKGQPGGAVPVLRAGGGGGLEGSCVLLGMLETKELLLVEPGSDRMAPAGCPPCCPSPGCCPRGGSHPSTSPCPADAVACSAIMAVGITSALLLHRHPQGVLLAQLLEDFAWLLEELLLRQQDVGFSGQLRALVQHSLSLLGPHLTFCHLPSRGDLLVVPKASAEARRELSQHSAAILPVFASEAVGACAIRALLLELLPFLGASPGLPSVVLSEEELCHKVLQLLQLLPPNLLGLQPCQPLDCLSQDVVDKLVLCGLLEAQE
ncbi:GPAT2 acyltransferase, partial [Psilopogon haemacephalus]|nr:GPAT2 acyltransferase [Psilopogon haemacephalus]